VGFDGRFASAVINEAILAHTILPMNNQLDFPNARRTGDFDYSTAWNVDRSGTYKVLVDSFATHNEAGLEAYFGATNLEFEPVPALRLKST
jgi:hypothetical protein